MVCLKTTPCFFNSCFIDLRCAGLRCVCLGATRCGYSQLLSRAYSQPGSKPRENPLPLGRELFGIFNLNSFPSFPGYEVLLCAWPCANLFVFPTGHQAIDRLAFGHALTSTLLTGTWFFTRSIFLAISGQPCSSNLVSSSFLLTRSRSFSRTYYPFPS